MNNINTLLGMIVEIQHKPRDERGLSQSTENAILLAGAATIALIIVVAITTYVESNLPS